MGDYDNRPWSLLFLLTPAGGSICEACRIVANLFASATGEAASRYIKRIFGVLCASAVGKPALHSLGLGLMELGFRPAGAIQSCRAE